MLNNSVDSKSVVKLKETFLFAEGVSDNKNSNSFSKSTIIDRWNKGKNWGMLDDAMASHHTTNQ